LFNFFIKIKNPIKNREKTKPKTKKIERKVGRGEENRRPVTDENERRRRCSGGGCVNGVEDRKEGCGCRRVSSLMFRSVFNFFI
jgi:hypothetical protein